MERQVAQVLIKEKMVLLTGKFVFLMFWYAKEIFKIDYLNKG